jgi:hypothetical protein
MGSSSASITASASSAYETTSIRARAQIARNSSSWQELAAISSSSSGSSSSGSPRNAGSLLSRSVCRAGGAETTCSRV